MPENASIALEQLRQAAARAGITVSDDVEMLLPLLGQIQAALNAVPDARLRNVEPLIVHDARRRGPL